MNEFLVNHASGEFLVRTALDINSAATVIEERWALDIESIHPASADDIRINDGQWTELDADV